MMLERALTNEVCAQIIELLLRKRWTVAKIARVVGAAPEYVQRVRDRKQSFQMIDVERLAKACKIEPHRLIFDSFQRDQLDPETQGLYDLALKEINSHAELKQVLMRKPGRKRRSGTKAA
jgi:hypothetical protein